MDTEVQEGGEHMYIYGWLILIFGRNQCNSVFIFQFKIFFNIFLNRHRAYLVLLLLEHLFTYLFDCTGS